MSLFGLIGYPVSHSGSKRYFDLRFNTPHPGLHSYQLFPLESIDHLPLLLEKFPHLEGLNVTVPFKEQVLSFLDETDTMAMEIGAVNTIRICHTPDRRVLKGFNTDAGGFMATISFTGHTGALILGTGGAARAVGYVLKKNGIRVQYVSRSKIRHDIITYADLTPSMIQEYSLIIQATPAGMSPETDTCPDIPYGALTERHFLYDLVYNPSETLFLKKGRQQGARCMNGAKMLHNQAELSYKIWGLI